jgi:hypothetical protein
MGGFVLLIPLLGFLGMAGVWKWWARQEGSKVAAGSGDARPAGYVGDEVCAECHRELYETYRRHPMGRSLAPVLAVAPREPDDRAAHNPFEATSFRYQVERRRDRVVHRESALDPQGQVLTMQDVEVHFAVGSGQRGRSYLINRDGYLFESPITWYPLRGIWDLSPGYRKGNLHFSRPVVATCLFCHCNQVEPVEHTANQYRLPLFRGHAIGCERCHGPGELHARRQGESEAASGSDDTIVNPRHLDHALREAVCQQCHLQGEERVVRRGRQLFDYRPGLPQHDFLVDFVKPVERGGDPKFVGTVEQMYASRCFRESSGPNKLGCISCHDPHALPAEGRKAAYYRERCLACHRTRGCSLSAERRQQGNADDCIACHMPRTPSDISHTAISDHHIPRRPTGPPDTPRRPGRARDRSPWFPFPGSSKVPARRRYPATWESRSWLWRKNSPPRWPATWRRRPCLCWRQPCGGTRTTALPGRLAATPSGLRDGPRKRWLPTMPAWPLPRGGRRPSFRRPRSRCGSSGATSLRPCAGVPWRSIRGAGSFTSCRPAFTRRRGAGPTRLRRAAGRWH